MPILACCPAPNLYDGSANGDADGVAETECSGCDQSHPKPLRQAEQAKAQRKAKGADDGHRSFTLDIARNEHEP